MPTEIFELPEDTASFLRTEAKAQKANGNGIWKLLEEAAECIDRLSRNLNGRDNFIVNLGLWDDFVRQLPKSPTQSSERGKLSRRLARAETKVAKLAKSK